jgi:Ni/Co efflux regulator RcnB
MKKLLVAALALFCATAIMVQAQDAAPKKAKKALTPEQQTVQTEMLKKYDTNKDGKLDKTERAAISQEDKDKMTAAGLGKKKAPATPAADAGK